MPFRPCSLGLLAFCLFLFFAAITAQDTPEPDFNTAHLTIRIAPENQADLIFQLTRNEALTSAQITAISKALNFEILGNPEAVTSDETASNGSVPAQFVYVYFGTKKSVLHRQGQRIEDEIKLTVLLTELKSVGVTKLDATIFHPNYGFPDFTPSEESSALPIDKDGYLAYHIPTDGTTIKTLRLAYGYTQQQIIIRFLILASLLTLPIVLAFLLGNSLLRKQQQQKSAVTISSLGLINLIGHFLPILWWASMYYANLKAFFSPWMNANSIWITTSTRIVLYVVPPMLTGLVCDALWQYFISRIKEEQKNIPSLIQQATLAVTVRILPLLLLYNGIFSLISSEYRQCVFFFLLYALLQSVLAKWQWKALGLNPYILPNGKLRHRAFNFANEAGVKLQQVFLIADTNGKTANAFSSSGNNILLTEYLLSKFSRREIDFIAAHEISHLQFKHDSKRAFCSLLAFPLVVIIMPLLGVALTILGFLSPWLIKFVANSALPVIVVFSIVVSTLIELYVARRFELAADAGSINLTGDPEAAITALVKLGKLNLEPIAWGKLNSKLLTHPSVIERVNSIAAKYSVSEQRVKLLLDFVEIDNSRYTSQAEIVELSSDNPLIHPTQKVTTELPKGKQIPLLGMPLLSALLGLAIGWLFTSPGYFPRTILDEYHLPALVIIIPVGILFGIWKARSIKRQLLQSLADRVDFAATSAAQSPTIINASELDGILAYTNELEKAGFTFLGDYSINTAPRTKMTGFIRLFVHPTYQCFAEVNLITNPLNRPRPIICTLLSELGDNWSYLTTNRELDGFYYGLRSNQEFWLSSPYSSPTNLLEFHLEKRTHLEKCYQVKPKGELTAASYILSANKFYQARKQRLQSKSIWLFLIDLDFFSINKKYEWMGQKITSRKTSPPINEGNLAQEVKV